MAVRARLRLGSPREAELALRGLVEVNLEQLAQGVPGIIRALRPDARGRRRIRYERSDPREEWLTLRDLWERGHGDCEDLAAASAAELEFKGIPARVLVQQVRPGLWHARVLRMDTGQVLDPSLTGGM